MSYASFKARRRFALVAPLIPIVVTAAFFAGCPSTRVTLVPGDLVIQNARIWTGDETNPWAEAMVVTDGRIAAVGERATADSMIGPDTVTEDLDGRLVLPGFHDTHVHPIEAGSPVLGNCILDDEAGAESLVPVLSGCAAGVPEGDWVLGWGHSIYSLLDAERSPREILDEAIPNHPAAMHEFTSHSVWANSAALALAGIDAESENPPGGFIVREPGGSEPNGILMDSVGDQVLGLALTPTPELDDLNYEGLLWSLEQLASNGITSIAEARTYVDRNYIELWERAEADDELTVRVTLGLWADTLRDDDEQLAELKGLLRRDPASRLQLGQVKIYTDGLLENTTAALIDPYLEDLGIPGGRGLSYFDSDRLTRYVTELEAAGFDMHIHAIGDRGVREALDAIEAARDTNGPAMAGRHHVTHVEYLHPDDLERFSRLDAFVSLQFSGWWTAEEYLHDADWLIGAERVDTEAFRIRDLLESNSDVVLNSDWDVGELSPFAGIARAIDRGDQSLPDVEAAVRAYTTTPARLLRQEAISGTLAVRMRADFVVVDRDIFSEDPASIAEARVLWTVLDGEETFRAPGF